MVISKKSLKRSPIGRLLLALCLLVSGCIGTTTATPLPANVFVDGAIPKSSVAGLRVNDGRGLSGLLEVEAAFQNQWRSQYHFVYRFIWFDNNNITIKSRLSKWKPLIVQGGISATLSGIAPSERVARYRLEIYSQDTIFKTKAPVNTGTK